MIKITDSKAESDSKERDNTNCINILHHYENGELKFISPEEAKEEQQKQWEQGGIYQLLHQRTKIKVKPLKHTRVTFEKTNRNKAVQYKILS